MFRKLFLIFFLLFPSQVLAEGPQKILSANSANIDLILHVAASGLPKSTMESCRKDPRAKPVCFSCDDAQKILNAKDRLKRWPQKCKDRVRRALESQKLDYEKRLKIKQSQILTRDKKIKALTKDAGKNKWLGPMLIGVAIGVAVASAIIIPIAAR